MTRARRLLFAWYLVLAGVALVTCWRQNLLFMADESITLAEGFLAFWPALLANHATTSITIDIFVFALAAVTWMAVEARRTGMRFVWLYAVFGLLVAISVTYPLFLAMRERRLAELAEPSTDLTPSDLLGLACFGVPVLAFALGSLAL